MQKSMVGEGLASSRNDMVMMRNGRRPSFAKATADRQAPPLQKCISLLVCISVFLFLCTPSALAASARQLPASYNESTYGDGTRDYTSLATWEAATDNNLVTAASGEVLTCYDDSAPYNDSLGSYTTPIAGAITNASYFRCIRAASGHEGTPTSGVRFEIAANAAVLECFRITESYVHLQDLGLKAVNSNNSGTSWAMGVQVVGSSYTGCEFVGCIVYECSVHDSNENGVRAIGLVSCNNTKVINCAVIDTGQDGDFNTRGNLLCYSGVGVSTTHYIYNFTSTGGTYGINIYNAGTSVVVNSKNCIFQDNTTDIFTYGSPTHNQTTNVTSGVTFDTDGYHLDSTDTGAIDQGTDLSGAAPENEAVFPFDDDIDGNTRSGTWDIGADEYVVPASPPPVVFKTGVRIGRNVLIKT